MREGASFPGFGSRPPPQSVASSAVRAFQFGSTRVDVLAAHGTAPEEARTQQLRAYSCQRRKVVQHVCVRSVGQRAVAFLGGYAFAHFLDLLAKPDLFEVVIVISEIARVVSAHAAWPDSAVGINLGADPAGIAADDLVFFLYDPLNQL